MDLRLRSLLHRVTTDPDTPDMAPDSVSDGPDTAPRQPSAGPPRLPEWWRKDKPSLDDLEDDEAQKPALLTKDDLDDDQEHGAADDFDDVDEGTDDDEDGGEKSRRWRPRGGSAGRVYRRPTYYDRKPAPKQALIEWWLHLPGRHRWLLYNGVALGAGFALGVPQFFTAETAFLVDTYDSWTAPYVLLWYGIALGIWAWDSRTRGWFPLFAITARIPLISMVIGVLLYGTPDLPA
ncbi:hypothetical protein [Streptomyces sp. NPDC053560]|uniref:hypothetical protein n=1 Tax=Streptomyces sp. NPDC053560 TaxID=3365711 RepID=UPI0037CE655A